jgi:transcription elongation factor GreA
LLTIPTWLRTQNTRAAKADQAINEARIAELEDNLARADVIDVFRLSGDTITFGATVTLIEELQGLKSGVVGCGGA